MGGMGDDIIGAPGSFSSWNIVDQMNFERELNDGLRRKREAKLAEEVAERTVEVEGEDND